MLNDGNPNQSSVSFVFLSTVFIIIDSNKEELTNQFMEKWYIQGSISYFGEQTLVLYKIFPNSALAQKEQSSLFF